MMTKCEFVSEQVFEHDYPFVRDSYTAIEVDGFREVLSWKPGVGYVFCYPDDMRAVCEGVGKQILTVVDVHKPGKYPTRVFYTRKFITPDGVEFGKNNLRIATLPAFRRLIAGYAYPYEPAGEDDIAELERNRESK